jgi:hypothetical protein
MIEDDITRRIELVAAGTAIHNDSNKNEQRSKKKRERGGETLVIVNPREKTAHMNHRSE